MNAISPTRTQDYPEWFQQVIQAADLAENSPVRGCMVIKPWGYAIWENIQAILDEKFKQTGHVNAYFPLLIPLSFLEKEAEHIEGFAKECAVVTHHRLEASEKGKLLPAGELEEPLIIRPTSETIIGMQYAKWVQSYRDLPIKINQWANVMRWEMRTRMFLRTSEFLWQEGHTAHATAEEAIAETRQMLDIYADFAQNYLAMPVIKGEKTPEERFPGAVNTYTIEAMMQDRKALQSGTSHFLGQNFAKSFDIGFSDETGKRAHAWTTSWGVSTRMIGGLIMTHSDDDGLVLPPNIAPLHVIIIPIYRNEADKNTVLDYCHELIAQVRALRYMDKAIRIDIDTRDINGGEKTWGYIKKGVPIRLEIGPRDVASNSVFMGRRDRGPKEKQSLTCAEFVQTLPSLLTNIQATLFARAHKLLHDNSHAFTSLDEFIKFFTPQNPDKPEIHGGFAYCDCSDDPAIEAILKQHKLSARCIPLDKALPVSNTCIFTGKPATRHVIFAKAY